MTSAAIGEALGISTRTVEAYRYNALRKLGAITPAHLAGLSSDGIVSQLRARISELEAMLAERDEDLARPEAHPDVQPSLPLS
jgi:hypothetical protein